MSKLIDIAENALIDHMGKQLEELQKENDQKSHHKQMIDKGIIKLVRGVENE